MPGSACLDETLISHGPHATMALIFHGVPLQDAHFQGAPVFLVLGVLGALTSIAARWGAHSLPYGAQWGALSLPYGCSVGGTPIALWCCRTAHSSSTHGRGAHSTEDCLMSRGPGGFGVGGPRKVPFCVSYGQPGELCVCVRCRR